jgi:hypothetical protein
MTRINTILAAGAVCAILGPGSFAQVDREGRNIGKHDPVTDRDHHYMVTLDDVIGAKVRLGALERDAKKADGAEVPTTKRSDTAKVKEGEVEDVIVDLRDGSFRWVIVGVGGLLGIGEKEVAVPANVLRREYRAGEKAGDKPVFVLSATEEELKKLAAFKKSDADDKDGSGIQAAVREAEASWGTLNRMSDVGEAKPATTKRDDDPARPAALTMLLGSCLDDYKLWAGNKEFGSVSKCIVDCPTSATNVHVGTDGKPADQDDAVAEKHSLKPHGLGVRYLVVSRGGIAGIGDTLYLVPLTACSFVKHEDKWTWSVPQTVEQLESGGVKYKKPDTGVLEHDMAKRADDYFKASKANDPHNQPR